MKESGFCSAGSREPEGFLGGEWQSTIRLIHRVRGSLCLELLSSFHKTRGTYSFFGFFFLFFSFFFGLFRATPAAYGGSQTRASTGAAAASLHHSSQQYRILNPLSETRD